MFVGVTQRFLQVHNVYEKRPQRAQRLLDLEAHWELLVQLHLFLIYYLWASSQCFKQLRNDGLPSPLHPSVVRRPLI